MRHLIVYCGNGGDWEFERDRIYWRQWIYENIPACEHFVIKPHEQADKAYLIFEAEKWNTIFLLQAPQYISQKHIKAPGY